VDEHSGLTELVHRGRRRRLLHLFANQLSLAVAVAFGGCILLLLLGTQILNWYWPVALFAASLAFGLWRARTSLPTGYQVARSIDERLKFNDSLSTAFYFIEHPERTSSPRDIVERQKAAAEAVVRSADVRTGIPFFAPRSLYACAALAMAAFGIFAIRYGVTRSLDLRPSLVQIAFDGFFGSPQEIAAAKRKALHPKGGDPLTSKSADPSQQETLDLNQSPENALNTVETPQPADSESGANSSNAKAGTKGEENMPQDQADSGQNSDRSSESDAASGKTSEKGGSPSKPDGSPQDAGASASTSGENSSLSEKVRDALANLLSTLKMQSKQKEGKQSAANSQNSSQSGQRQAANKDQKGSQESGKAQNTEASASDSEGEQAQSGEQSQSSQGDSSRKNSDRASAQDGKSGIGKEDGDKSIREAEQLAAMGKISEIIGKRAQNVTGEVMVEVASGKQQLKTQYSQRSATHVEAGSQIDRDEVPLAYQQYVQQYFEEIRKLPSGKGTKSKTPSL